MKDIDERLEEALETGDFPPGLVDDVSDAKPEDRKHCARVLRDESDTGVGAVPVIDTLLSDPERSVRLTAVKAVVDIASESPGAVKPLAEKLDDLLYDEFYFVRGRSAEAVGYIVHEYPDAEGIPSTVGITLFDALSLDESEVRRKVAKAISMVACSRPEDVLPNAKEVFDHADDDDAVVRYHLLTTLVALALRSPSEMEPHASDVEPFLEDENPYVRGRAVEFLGLVDPDVLGDLESREYEHRTDEAEEFESLRVEWAFDDDGNLVESLHAETDEKVRGVEREASDATLCPNCGEPVPDTPTCPRCGAPHGF